MRWTYLGHAMWLAQAGRLRILFDPLLDGTSTGGVFEVVPRRRLDVSELRPDFIVVSHRHPDHFDPESLRQLAQLDPETVVLTSDPLVSDLATAVGFSTVALLDAMQRVRLADGVTLLTTPSAIPPDEDPEWGVMVATADGVVWNQVDTVFRGLGDVHHVLQQAELSLGEVGAPWPLALVLARWLPMREIEAALGQATGFPLEAYRQLLEEIAALGAHRIVPSAAGQRHRPPYDAMNRLVYPLSPSRFVRDIGRRSTALASLAPVGSTWHVSDGRSYPGEACPWVDIAEPEPPTDFRPVAALPELSDPGHPDLTETQLRERCERWVRDILRPSLEPDLGTGDDPHRLTLRIVYASGEQCFTLLKQGPRVTVREGYEVDYDVYNAIVGSMFVDVIEGRRHWGEPLLAGLLRATRRSYRVVAGAPLQPTGVGTVFLYHGLSYRDSHERAIARYLRSLTR